MAVRVRLPGVLRQHAGGSSTLSLELDSPATLADLLDRLAVSWPALERRLRDETGALRRHVNVYVDDARANVGSPLAAEAEVLVVASVSGG
jgi:molybdopterin synthase sulfur carrier subunit